MKSYDYRPTSVGNVGKEKAENEIHLKYLFIGVIIFNINGFITIVESSAKINFLLFLSFQLTKIGNQNFMIQFVIE